MVKYKGKELHKYSKQELMEIIEAFLAREEARERTPIHKKRVSQSWGGKGTPGGK